MLSHDFFRVPDDEIRNIVSVLTAVDGKVVYADEEYRSLDPGVPPVMPDWSPVRFGSRYWKRDAAHPVQRALPNARACLVHGRAAAPAQDHAEPHGFWGALGCACWAF